MSYIVSIKLADVYPESQSALLEVEVATEQADGTEGVVFSTTLTLAAVGDAREVTFSLASPEERARAEQAIIQRFLGEISEGQKHYRAQEGGDYFNDH
jgi:hypothetical protein